MKQDKALVLDFGGVISRTLFETHAQTEAALGLEPGSLNWRGPFDPVNDALWREMEADRISERDYWLTRTHEVGVMVGEKWTRMEEFVQRARGADVSAVLRPEALAAIELAHQSGVRLAILSNELDLFYGAGFSAQLPLLKRFDVVVDATYTHILKPDARAYTACLSALDLPASACVFVDDQLRNVQGAQRVGIPTVHFDVKRPGASYCEALRLLGIAEDPSLHNLQENL